jgi:hypothetical protein
MIGLYRITLLPAADEQAFVKRMTEVVFTDVSALQLTRITAGFHHQLLKGRTALREYVWHVTASLVTDHEYDFAQNIERVQNSLDGAGVVTGVESFINVDVNAET